MKTAKKNSKCLKIWKWHTFKVAINLITNLATWIASFLQIDYTYFRATVETDKLLKENQRLKVFFFNLRLKLCISLQNFNLDLYLLFLLGTKDGLAEGRVERVSEEVGYRDSLQFLTD